MNWRNIIPTPEQAELNQLRAIKAAFSSISLAEVERILDALQQVKGKHEIAAKSLLERLVRGTY